MAVLFVEDEGALAHVMHLFADSMGIDHGMASCAEEALQELEHKTYDLVLTDLNMPGMTGIALREEIRKRWPELPVFANTAGIQGYSTEDLELIFDRVYFKPGDISRMMAEILTVLIHVHDKKAVCV